MNKDKEAGRVIEGYPHYLIYPDASIRSFAKGRDRFLTPAMTKKGYMLVGLSRNGTQKHYSVHRLVALAFLPNPENKKTINHINGVRNDNRLENLEWATDSEQQRHSFDVLGRKPSGKGRKGKLHPFSTPIRQCDLSGNLIEEFESVLQASELTKVSRSQIRRGLDLKVPASGFIWQFSIHDEPKEGK